MATAAKTVRAPGFNLWGLSPGEGLASYWRGRGSIYPAPTIVSGEMPYFRPADSEPNRNLSERKGVLARPNMCKTCTGGDDLGLKILLPGPNISLASHRS